MESLRLLVLAALALAATDPALLSTTDPAKKIADYWPGTLLTPRGDLLLIVD